MPYLKDVDPVKRRRALALVDNILERYVDAEAQKEEKAREVRACRARTPDGVDPARGSHPTVRSSAWFALRAAARRGAAATPQKSTDNIELVRWVSMLAPRCTDPVEASRATTISCIARLMTLKGMLFRVSDTLAEKLNVIKCVPRLRRRICSRRCSLVAHAATSVKPGAGRWCARQGAHRRGRHQPAVHGCERPVQVVGSRGARPRAGAE